MSSANKVKQKENSVWSQRFLSYNLMDFSNWWVYCNNCGLKTRARKTSNDLHFHKGESFGAAIWQIPELYGELNSPQLERITSLDTHAGKIKWWVVMPTCKFLALGKYISFIFCTSSLMLSHCHSFILLFKYAELSILEKKREIITYCCWARCDLSVIS